MADANRVTQAGVEAITDSIGQRVTQAGAEVFTDSIGQRVTQAGVEVIGDSSGSVNPVFGCRFTQAGVEVIGDISEGSGFSLVSQEVELAVVQNTPYSGTNARVAQDCTLATLSYNPNARVSSDLTLSVNSPNSAKARLSQEVVFVVLGKSKFPVTFVVT